MGCVSSLLDEMNEQENKGHHTHPQPNSNQYNQAVNQNAYYPQASSSQPQSNQVAQSVNANPKAEKGSQKFIPSDASLTTKRGVMEIIAKEHEDFLMHHLRCELSLSKLTSTNSIRKRQILEHFTLQELWGSGYKASTIREFSIKAWMQRTMLDIFEIAHREFFVENKSYDAVRKKIVQKYMFEIWQLKEFVDAGFGGRFSTILDASQLQFSIVTLQSDSALFGAFKLLKERYPQVPDNTEINFPEVKTMKNDCNLLNNFPSKCYSDPGFINIQILASDLKYMIDKAAEDFSDFQKDMKLLLGDHALTDSKVKKITKNGREEYTASPVRRVFIKWAETIIERIPDIIYTEAFMEFIKSKRALADNFVFKSTIQPTTHNLVIQYLGLLLETAKYQIKSQVQRKEFGFFIYDLLRCKTHKKTGEEVVELINKLQTLKQAPSGKRFEVIRVKDRLRTPNRDVMVNFRYGDVVVAEAQLCIDATEESEKGIKDNKFCHYIYELQRGLFGPTLEIMMQYEDFERTDIFANLQTEGEVRPRSNKGEVNHIQKSSRKCYNGHDMLSLTGNYFICGPDGVYLPECSIGCDYCGFVSQSTIPYDYCYFCTIVFCQNCTDTYQEDYQKLKKMKWLCNQDSMGVKITSANQLQNEVKKNSSLIAVFYESSGAASTIFKDSLVYIYLGMQVMKKDLPKLAFINVDNQNAKSIAKSFNIISYPTTIVFDSKMNPQLTLIGASLAQINGVFEVYFNLAQGKSKVLPLMCHCQEYMKLTPVNEFFECYYCWNNQLPVQANKSRKQALVCPNGHARCLECSYLSMPQPSLFRDPLGLSYLNNFNVTPKLFNCSKGHPLKYSKINELDKIQYDCLKCKKVFLFSDEDGMGACIQCQQFACSNCIGTAKQSFATKQSYARTELVTHHAELCAEEAYRCLCNRFFKKCYQTRALTQESAATQNMAYSNKKKQWQCLVCKRMKPDGELHISCFTCPKILEDAKVKFNIDFCLDCAIVVKILNNQKDAKIQEKMSDFICNSNHPMFFTSKNYDQSTRFACQHCKKNFYINNEKYFCKTCKIYSCTACAYKCLKSKNPPKCLHNCGNNHKLAFQPACNSLQICDGCTTVIRGPFFKCDADSYSICLSCGPSPMLPKPITEYIASFENHQKSQVHNLNLGGNQEEQSESEGSGNDLANAIGDFFS